MILKFLQKIDFDVTKMFITNGPDNTYKAGEVLCNDSYTDEMHVFCNRLNMELKKTVKFIGYENVGLFRFKLHTGNLEINDKKFYFYDDETGDFLVDNN